MRKFIVHEDDKYGEIGERVPTVKHNIEMYVGDLVMYSSNNHSYHVGFVVKELSGIYSMFGYCGIPLTESSNIKCMKVVVPYQLVTEELLQKYSLDVEEAVEVPMTHEEIEERLGHPVLLVDGKYENNLYDGGF